MTSQNDPQYLSHLSNAVIINPIITHVSGNVGNGSSQERYGLKLLLDNISKGASHDAAERGDPPRCHSHTRTAIRTEIMEWIQSPDPMRKMVLWMYGPAGAGKTAIAQSIAEECKKQGLLAASFFFGRFAAGRNDTTRFAATIAYQLWRSIPETREQIISAIEQDPNVFSLDLATQLQVLVIIPLKSLPPSSRPIFVITDGVDECGPTRESHTTLLNALATATSELRHIPLIFFIASRPEYEIREAFNGDLLSPLVKSLVLDDKYKPDEDIKLYLNSTFQIIHDKHVRLGSRLPSSWPTETDVERLVSKASGQFIFASTVMRFIGLPRYHPPERLDIVLGLLAPGNETPFAQLDALYHYILSSVTDLPKVLEILKFLFIANYDDKKLSNCMTVDVAEALLGFAIGPVLVDMHALIFVPSNPHSKLRIHHASLYDFLLDRSRSHNHYLDMTKGHIALGRRWLKLVANYPHIPTPFSLHNCVACFSIHCNKLAATSSEIVEDLASFNLTMLLDKVHFRDLYLSDWTSFFTSAKKLAGDRVDVFPGLRDEFDAFILERLSRYPSALGALIPPIFVYSDSCDIRAKPSTIRNIFDLCLYALNPSETELAACSRLDLILLNIRNINFLVNGAESIFSTLFKDRSRAGQFFVDGESYALLAKQMVRSFRPMPGRDKHQAQFVEEYTCERVFNSNTSCPNPTILIPCVILVSCFRDIISNASVDLELAMLLHKRVLQYDGAEFVEEHHRIAEIGLEYIKKCGIPYLNHVHFPNTDKCIVCEKYGDPSVVVNEPPLPVPISSGDALPVPRAPFFGSPRIWIRDRLRFLTKRRHGRSL